MIDTLTLQNFKACQDLKISLKPLTILSGLNSSGKSSVLQSFALIAQSYNKKDGPGLLINGEYISLGLGVDILSESAEKEQIVISMHESGKVFTWKCDYNKDRELLPFKEKPADCPHFVESDFFQYLQANRISPDLIYPRATNAALNKHFLGTHGEFTVDILRLLASEDVSKTRRITDVGSNKLVDHVELWLQKLSPGVKINLDKIDRTDFVRIGYKYSLQNRDVDSNQYRPTNVGFGLTYVLPVIVACLVAPRDSLILLENPEAHLHPRGQSAMGELLSRCANDGVQIIVETHSDHLLNGVRLAVKNGLLNSNSVIPHFFKLEGPLTKVQTPTILDSGRLTDWPDGFFDEWDKNLDELLS